MIGVIDYRAGNAPSVMYALESLGLPHRLVASADDLDGCDRIILPGVGAARATLESLRRVRPRRAARPGRHRGPASRSSGSASGSRCCSSTARRATSTAWAGSPARCAGSPAGPGAADRVEHGPADPSPPGHRRPPRPGPLLLRELVLRGPGRPRRRAREHRVRRRVLLDRRTGQRHRHAVPRREERALGLALLERLRRVGRVR